MSVFDRLNRVRLVNAFRNIWVPTVRRTAICWVIFEGYQAKANASQDGGSWSFDTKYRQLTSKTDLQHIFKLRPCNGKPCKSKTALNCLLWAGLFELRICHSRKAACTFCANDTAALSPLWADNAPFGQLTFRQETDQGDGIFRRTIGRHAEDLLLPFRLNRNSTAEARQEWLDSLSALQSTIQDHGE